MATLGSHLRNIGSRLQQGTSSDLELAAVAPRRGAEGSSDPGEAGSRAAVAPAREVSTSPRRQKSASALLEADPDLEAYLQVRQWTLVSARSTGGTGRGRRTNAARCGRHGDGHTVL